MNEAEILLFFALIILTLFAFLCLPLCEFKFSACKCIRITNDMMDVELWEDVPGRGGEEKTPQLTIAATQVKQTLFLANVKCNYL